MKKSNYNFIIIIATPIITFIIAILLLGLVEQNLSVLQSGNNNGSTTPDLQRLPRQPAPTIRPKTERSMPSLNNGKSLEQGEWKAFLDFAIATGLPCLPLQYSSSIFLLTGTIWVLSQ